MVKRALAEVGLQLWIGIPNILSGTLHIDWCAAAPLLGVPIGRGWCAVCIVVLRLVCIVDWCVSVVRRHPITGEPRAQLISYLKSRWQTD